MHSAAVVPVRVIGAVTCSRSDYGPLRPVLKALHGHPKIDLQLFAGGMHLSREFGLTIREVEKDNFNMAASIDMLLSSDSPEGQAKMLGLGLLGFSQAFARCRPEVVLLLGDRLELLSAAMAALSMSVPVAHIHGGEITEGSLDDVVRHSLTKMSHLHFVSTEIHGRRVIQMGEEPWRVIVSGAPGIDALLACKPMTRSELSRHLNFPLDPSPLLVTLHPDSLHLNDNGRQIHILLKALSLINKPVLFTYPNADAGGRAIIAAIHDYVHSHKNAVVLPSVGTRVYQGLLRHCLAMVGNSSSGLIEAPSFGLPVVNVGERQRGRLRTRNVVDVEMTTDSIVRGIQLVLVPSFRTKLKNTINPYGDGKASLRIVRILSQVPLGSRFLHKKFIDSFPDHGR